MVRKFGWVVCLLAGLACHGSSGSNDKELSHGQTWYVTATAISDPSGTNVYIGALPQVPTANLDLSKAREFPNWSDVRVFNGKVFVSDGQKPTITRYAIATDGTLVEDGTIGFDHYGSTGAPLYLNVFASPEKAYVQGLNKYIVWNPETLTITGTIPYPSLPARNGLNPQFAFDRGMKVKDGRFYQAVSWLDYTSLKTDPRSAVIVIDTASDTVVQTLDLPCPDLGDITEDASGNLYLSNWIYSVSAPFLWGGAETCMIQLDATQTQAASGWPVTFKSLTGHEGTGMFILGSGRALFSMFDETHDSTQTTDKTFSGPNWRTYAFDLTTKTASLLPGVNWNSGFQPAHVDGRDFLLTTEGNDYSKTRLYEVGATGGATSVTLLDGWVTRLLEVTPE